MLIRDVDFKEREELLEKVKHALHQNYQAFIGTDLESEPFDRMAEIMLTSFDEWAEDVLKNADEEEPREIREGDHVALKWDIGEGSETDKHCTLTSAMKRRAGYVGKVRRAKEEDEYCVHYPRVWVDTGPKNGGAWWYSSYDLEVCDPPEDEENSDGR